MKTRLMMMASALVASLFCLPAMAQPAPDAGPGMMQGNGPAADSTPATRPRPPRDCSKAHDPAACTEQRAMRNKFQEACKEMRGQQRQQCMQEQMEKIDCSTTVQPLRCAAHQSAARDCQGQRGAAYRQCMQQKMPAPDCSQAPDPNRCTQQQKARAACRDKQGTDYRSCIRGQYKTK